MAGQAIRGHGGFGGGSGAVDAEDGGACVGEDKAREGGWQGANWISKWSRETKIKRSYVRTWS